MASQIMQKKNKRHGRSVFFKQRVMGYAFIAPAIIMFAVFTVVPFILGFWYSFTDFNLYAAYNLVGFGNYRSAFMNAQFGRSFLNVIVYAIIVIPLSIITSFFAAVMVNTKIRGAKVYRVMFYIPAVTSGIAVAFIFNWIYRGNEEGVLNTIIGAVGIGPIEWLNSFNYRVMFSLAAMAAWISLGGNMLIWLAALKGVSPELYEASSVDGANAWQKIWYVTLPSIAPTLYFIVTMSVIGAFQLLDPVVLMVPQTLALNYARTPMYEIFINGFTGFMTGGYAAAMSIVLFVVIMAFTFVTQRFFKEDRTA